MSKSGEASKAAPFEKRRRLLEEALERALPAGQGPPRIYEAMRYSVLSGGKRVRGMLVLAGAEALDCEIKDVMPAACSLELLHAYSLVHDDLPCMDDDDMRRGKPTCHKVYGEAMATLCGDALLTLAFKTLLRVARVEWIGPARALRALDELAEAAGAEGLIGGQVADLLSQGKDVDRATVEYIHTRKTGALIRAAVRMGGILAGAEGKPLQALTQYGERVGFAFQIVDDCLNEEGDERVMGKRSGSDRTLRKATYARLVDVTRARDDAGALIRQAVAALEPFGESGRSLRELARFVAVRDR